MQAVDAEVLRVAGRERAVDEMANSELTCHRCVWDSAILVEGIGTP